MKKILITAAGLLSIAYGQGRLETASNTSVVATQETRIVLDNLHLQHNSQSPQLNCIVRFTGNTATGVGGINKLQVFAIEIDKTAGELQLQQDVTVADHVRFFNGKLNLAEAVVQLAPTAKLLNETETNRAYTTGNGYVTITTDMNAPSLVNAGNLGVFVTSASNLGSVTIRRGHKPQAGTGLTKSISRYYDIVPATNGALDATVELLYFDAELNGQEESALSLVQSTNSGTAWTSLGFDQRSATDNYIRKAGLASLYRYTISSATGTTLPVSGLEFIARRLNKQVVQLDWKTAQEMDNKGFSVERKKDNEPAFSAIHFAPSKGVNGNSNAPLNYLHVDQNNFAGKTWYRLKQEDGKGAFTYSLVRVVDGEGGNVVILKAWPIPAPKEFSVTVTGTEKDMLQLYDASGKLVRQQNITAGEVVMITGLTAGTYVLKLANQNEVVQKVIVQ
ncbi:T9SS type A sorting domain-containing protein [Flavisolibacter sp. BT320]|nr:T9SS type A sorting domain-containing protein [Flavisolibacter longurius]